MRVTVLGEILLTLGVGALLFIAYEIYGTDLATAGDQRDASAQLDRLWAGPVAGAPVPVGRPMARIHVPALGASYVRTVFEGVDQDVLAKGPGHYPGTALPGEVGNAAVAGHRVTHGGPFDGLGELRSCDAIVVETGAAWLVYRVLPFSEERASWARSAATRPACAGVTPLTGGYTGVTGREIVAPTGIGVIAPVPDHAGAAPGLRLLTLTTCNPRFSARQRLVLHAVLTVSYPRAGHPAGWRPAELVPS